MTDGYLLKYFLARQGVSVNELAEILQLTRGTMSKKINGRADFSLQEVRRIAKILSLTKEDVWSIFFASKTV